jgi:beta-glucanase (GH16 family)
MSRYFPVIVIAFLAVAALRCPEKTVTNSDQDNIVAPEGWELIWHDEFDQDSVDTAKWTVVQRENSYNNELQYYVAEDVYIEDGCLR